MMQEVLVAVASAEATVGASKMVMDFRSVAAMQAGTVPFFWRYEMALVIRRHFSHVSRLLILQLPSQLETDRLIENMLSHGGIAATVTSQPESGMRWLMSADGAPAGERQQVA